jgi:hypothetical protein
MKTQEILPGIYHAVFPSQEELATTFLRFQEFFESPRFRGMVFTLDQFKQWYLEEAESFSYCEDVSGFNVPSSVFEPFFEGQFDPLSASELALLEQFRHLRGSDFYVIGTYGDEFTLDILQHEIAHGLYHTHPQYKAEVDAVLAQLTEEARQEAYAALAELGDYHPNVYDDELHAYLTTGFDKLEPLVLDSIKFQDVSDKLRVIFNTYCTHPLVSLQQPELAIA